jgi:iron complex transport system ATP-binding protein
MSPGPSVRVADLGVRFGARRALADVGLEAHPGEFLALAGPNGAGKTTLLRAILGLQRPEEGTVEILGRPIDGLSFRERALRMAWLPQEEATLDNVPIFDYVLFGRYAHTPPFARPGAEDRRAARAALEGVGLWDRRSAGILELSGGERQRVLVARAIAQATPILLLDEPTAHVDIGHQLELLGRVAALAHESGRTAIAAMHDLNLAARFADRLAVLSRGRLVEVGPPSEVLSEGLLRDVWGVDAQLRRDPRSGLPYLLPVLPLDASRGRPRPRRQRGPIHVVGGGGSAADLLRRLVADGFLVTAGALPLLDTDTQTGEELGLRMAVEIPFAPLSDEVRGQHRALLGEAAAVVLAPFAVGPNNLANLEDVRDSCRPGAVLVWTRPPWRARDFTGGRANAIVEALLTAGAIPIGSETELSTELDRRLPPAIESDGPTGGPVGARA